MSANIGDKSGLNKRMRKEMNQKQAFDLKGTNHDDFYFSDEGENALISLTEFVMELEFFNSQNKQGVIPKGKKSNIHLILNCVL